MILETEFLQLVEHAKRRHPVANLRPVDLWKILHSTMKSTGRFDNIFLLIELCLAAPYANAQVEHHKIPRKVIKHFIFVFQEKFIIHIIIHRKHAGIPISGHLEGLKSQKFPGRCPWTPNPSYFLPRFARSHRRLATLASTPRFARPIQKLASLALLITPTKMTTQLQNPYFKPWS